MSFADETRPFLQGARLTVWELQHDNIPATLITDNMAGHFLHSGRIGCVVVGADRIAANGDVANKIGTYGVAVLAKENGIPFYVAAPVSTLDLSLFRMGRRYRSKSAPRAEVTHVFGVRVAPEGTEVRNPAFDVTPNRYVTAIITEKGWRARLIANRCASLRGLQMKTRRSASRRRRLLAPPPADYSNRRAPGFSLPDSAFEQHDPQDYRGKVLLVDVMLTTCPICNQLADTLV